MAKIINFNVEDTELTEYERQVLQEIQQEKREHGEHEADAFAAWHREQLRIKNGCDSKKDMVELFADMIRGAIRDCEN